MPLGGYRGFYCWNFSWTRIQSINWWPL